jgi:hypothetical protein
VSGLVFNQQHKSEKLKESGLQISTKDKLVPQSTQALLTGQ